MSMATKANPLLASIPRYLAWRAFNFRTICSGRLGFMADPDPSLASAPTKVLETFTEEFEIGNRLISFGTGKLARFANGAVVMAMEETKVLSTITCAQSDGSRDFLPLTVGYQEKQYAQGVIPSTFMRREGAPKERELLVGRLIDIPIGPLFPAGFYHEVQVMASVLSSDGKQDPDVMAANAISAVLMLLDMPWGGPIGVIRIGRICGQLIINPSMDALSISDLNLVYACTKDKTLMIDVQAREISEKDLKGASSLAHPEAVRYLEPQIRLASKAGKQKKEYRLSMMPASTMEKIKNLSEARVEAVFTDSTYGKFERGEALDTITQDVKRALEEECDEESLKRLSNGVDTVRKQVSRVSDVVSVGQQLSLMCLGMDVCGNIKLSLRATLAQTETKESFVDDSPTTSAETSPHIRASVRDRSTSQAKQGRNEEQLVNEDEVDEVKFSTASNTFFEPRSVASWTKTIHRFCTVDRNVDEALQLLDSLRLRGYRPNSLNLSSVIHALCRARRYAEAHQRLLFFIASQCIPDERTCNVLIACLLDSETPHATYHLICRLIKLIPELVPSLTNYNRLIHQFCKSLEPNVAHRLFFDMMDRGHCPNVVSYTTLINGYCKCGEFGIARKLFNEMSEVGVVPNSLTISVLLSGVLRSHDTQCAKELIDQLWEKMRNDYDSSVNCAAFANVVESLCGEGFFSEVFQIAEDVPQGTSVSEAFAYAQMIDSLCRVGRYHGASRVVHIMRRRGITPSLLSYNSIIHGLSVDGGCMRAFQLFQEGIQFGYVPSEYTYRILVESLCQEGDVPKAKEILQFFIKQKAVDRTRLYNIYIKALCLVNNATELLNTLVSMLQMQCKPDVITLNTVINGFCKMGRIDDAMKVFNDMTMGEFCPPDSVTFTTVLCGLLNAGKTEEALVLLQEKMPERGLIPNVVTYNAVLRGLFKLKKTDEAMEIYKTMVTQGVSADSTTYTIIIDGLFDADRVGDAKRLWDETIWPSNVHDNFVYASILKGLIHSGRLGEACDFLYELVDCRVSPNIVNYNILIDGACNLGLKKQAYQIVGEMRKNGLSPDAVTWRILEKLHGNVSTH